MSRRTYSDKDLELLKRYAREGLGADAAAKALGRNRQAVIAAARRYGYEWNKEAAAKRRAENGGRTRRAKVQASGDWMSPDGRERQRQAVRRHNLERYADPAARKAQAAQLLALRQLPEVEAKRRAGVERWIRRLMSWCPEDRLQTYYELRQMKISAPDARAIIEAEIEREAKRTARIAAQEREQRFERLRRSGGRPTRFGTEVSAL